MTADPPTGGSRARRITSGVLLALAILAVVLGPIMLYVRTQFLASSQFRDRAETALASPDVQSYLAGAITTNLVAAGGAEAERAEPLIRAVAAGVVASDAFKAAFGRAVEGLNRRLQNEGAADRVIEVREAATRAVDAVAVVRPELAQRIRDASAQIPVGQGTTAKRLAQIAHRAQQLRVLAIVLPIVAFVLLALSIAVSPQRLRAARRAGWGLIAGGVVVSAVSGLTHRILTDLVDDPQVRRAVGDAENAFLGDLGTWGAWVTAIGVVVVGTAIFLGSTLTLREQVARGWAATTSRPAGAWALVLRILALVVLILLVIFALDAVLKLLVGVAVGLLAAYGVAELLRLAGVGPRRRGPASA
jgi:hypothetical protein